MRILTQTLSYCRILLHYYQCSVLLFIPPRNVFLLMWIGLAKIRPDWWNKIYPWGNYSFGKPWSLFCSLLHTCIFIIILLLPNFRVKSRLHLTCNIWDSQSLVFQRHRHFCFSKQFDSYQICIDTIVATQPYPTLPSLEACLVNFPDPLLHTFPPDTKPSLSLIYSALV